MIKVEGLTGTYGSFIAVDDISFVCQPGTVTGFLGPNGAGKTTTMRVMVGLTPATHGEVTIGGLHYQRHPQPRPARRRPARRLGPARRPHRPRGARARRPHHGPARLARRRDARRWSRSTTKESKRRVRNYSLGMRQRLGIAHALLGDPSVLILDEPANGLDPAGIRWMRGLLKGYADRGGTVLLSSHLLHEVEQIADEMILIGRGRIVAQGTNEVAARRAPARSPHAGHRARQRGAGRGAGRQGLRRSRRPATASASRPSRSRSAASPPSSGIVLTDLRAGTRAASRTCSSSSPPTPSATTSRRRSPA